jgi:hypothetical protein
LKIFKTDDDEGKEFRLPPNTLKEGDKPAFDMSLMLTNSARIGFAGQES